MGSALAKFKQPQTENIKKKSRNFHKVKLEFSMHWQLFRLHLHCIRYNMESGDDLRYTGGYV